ncbi:N-acyl homoserine lactonase family protein [Microbacterium sp. YMB-B2]|uniref:N-acyl homoserine lactonase family protein n=1 Tax=Microbacterium tenebrionis TaxID=2830665 RepID=A0A9X1LQE6_9MICO|nr:N-acyl homoserine lactonase family protein [Microbacterium tenebrionis]MCC2030049.1 N-acyl homoserine lactonase family protein [Microbacterium tenebrionis]
MDDNDDDRYEVVIVRYGTRQTSRSDVFLNYGVYGLDDAPIDMDYFVWIVRNSRRTILVDTGYSVEGGTSRGRTLLMEPTTAWRMLDIDLDAEIVVVLTHAHYDHAGNLSALPAAEVVVAQSEIDFWLGRLSQRAQFRHSADEADLAALALARAEGRVTAFRGRISIAPGIEVIEVGGHTPGQAVVLVQTAAGPVLLASDAVHYYEELDDDMPFTYVADLPRMYEAFDQITRMSEAGDVTHLVAGHDPSTLQRFPPYEAIPGGLSAIIGRNSP